MRHVTYLPVTAGLTRAVLVAVLTAGASLAVGQAPALDASPIAEANAACDAKLARLFPPKGPGLAILVARNGRVLFERGYGLADLQTHEPIDTDTVFRICSITKEFTGVAVMKLSDMGKLSVADPLSRFLPDYPNGDVIRLRHLLTHTSGIHDFAQDPSFLFKAVLPTTRERLIASFRDAPVNFPPGVRTGYGSSDYVLLREVIERASGKTYEEFLATNFWKPLGMTSSGVYHNESPPPRRAAGYISSGNGFGPALNWHMTQGDTAGCLYSTVGDLHLWSEAFFGGRVLQPACVAAATEVRAPGQPPAKTGFGYGWQVDEWHGVRWIGHNGAFPGWATAHAYFPDKKLTVIALSNCFPAPPGVTAQLPQEIAELYFKAID